MHGYLHDSYKHWFNKAERAVTGDPRQAARFLNAARVHAETGEAESRTSRENAATVPGRRDQDPVAPASRLSENAIQPYLNLPDVAVPAAKQPSARKAIRAAGAVTTAAYLPAEPGSDLARRRFDTLRERTQKAWKDLIGRDADAVKAGTQVHLRMAYAMIAGPVSHIYYSFAERGLLQQPAVYSSDTTAKQQQLFASDRVHSVVLALDLRYVPSNGQDTETARQTRVESNPLDPEGSLRPSSSQRRLHAPSDMLPLARQNGWLIAHLTSRTAWKSPMKHPAASSMTSGLMSSRNAPSRLPRT